MITALGSSKKITETNPDKIFLSYTSHSSAVRKAGVLGNDVITADKSSLIQISFPRINKEEFYLVGLTFSSGSRIGFSIFFNFSIAILRLKWSTKTLQFFSKNCGISWDLYVRAHVVHTNLMCVLHRGDVICPDALAAEIFHSSKHFNIDVAIFAPGSGFTARTTFNDSVKTWKTL